jgi:hypothetical protein
MEWVHLTHGRDNWQAVINVIQCGKFLDYPRNYLAYHKAHCSMKLTSYAKIHASTFNKSRTITQTLVTLNYLQ